jgi:YebC/PmpR family DNA-binding regulatory protein
MSGHSKWATTKRKKESVDAKRSANFTKLANVISIAARAGGDPETNFKLRMAIDKAKEYSLPKENIERAIKRGTGELLGSQIEEITYEGFGPEGIAFIIEVITDNKNRASAEVKHLLTKYGGSLGGPGNVMWQFERKGVIILKQPSLTENEELALIDAGIADIDSADGITIYTKLEDFQKIKEKVESLKLPILEANLEYVAKEKIKPKNEETVTKLYEDLDACDDVSNFYSNADL